MIFDVKAVMGGSLDFFNYIFYLFSFIDKRFLASNEGVGLLSLMQTDLCPSAPDETVSDRKWLDSASNPSDP